MHFSHLCELFIECMNSCMYSIVRCCPPSLRAVGAVAEMTGRRGRVVGDARGRGVYQLRAKPDSTEMDSLNVSETGICSTVVEQDMFKALQRPQ